MGSFTASETAPQQRHAVADSNAAHREDLLQHLARNGRAVDPDDPSLDVLIGDGAGAVAWLEALGVPFSGPHPERPHRAYRLHCALPNGAAYVEALARALAARGGSVRCEQVVTDLQRTPDGVLAARVAGSATPLVAGAVVLAAGDYSGAVERFRPGEAPPVEPLRDWARGDAQELGRALGGALHRMDEPLTPAVRFADPPYTEPDAALYASGAILVDERGQRLDRDGAPLGRTPAVLAATRAYTVFGGELAERMAPPCRRRACRARRLAPRAGACSSARRAGAATITWRTCWRVPAAARATAPRRWARPWASTAWAWRRHSSALNAARAGQTTLLPIARPPYYALGPLRPRLLLTHGGLRVDAAMQVLGADAAPLPALFAAGNAAAAIVSAGGHGYGIGWAIISGRRAGQSAARAARAGGTL